MGGYLGASWWRRRPYWGWIRRTRTSTPWWKTWTKIVRQNYKLHAFTCSRGQWLKYHVKSVHSCGEPSFSLFGLGPTVNPIGYTMYRIKQRLVMQTLSQHNNLTTFSPYHSVLTFLFLLENNGFIWFLFDFLFFWNFVVLVASLRHQRFIYRIFCTEWYKVYINRFCAE